MNANETIFSIQLWFRTTIIGGNDGGRQGEESSKGKWLLPPDDIADVSPLAGFISDQWDTITNVIFKILMLYTNQDLWLALICVLN